MKATILRKAREIMTEEVPYPELQDQSAIKGMLAP